MSDEKNLGKSTEQVAAEEIAAPETEAVKTEETVEAAKEAPKAAPRVSAHNTAAAAAFNASNEEVDIRRKGGEKIQLKIKTNKIPYEKKKNLYGYGFVALWAIGTIWLFIIPVIKSLWYSLCDTSLLDKSEALLKGMTSAGIYTEWNNFYNYRRDRKSVV